MRAPSSCRWCLSGVPPEPGGTVSQRARERERVCVRESADARERHLPVTETPIRGSFVDNDHECMLCCAVGALRRVRPFAPGWCIGCRGSGARRAIRTGCESDGGVRRRSCCATRATAPPPRGCCSPSATPPPVGRRTPGAHVRPCRARRGGAAGRPTLYMNRRAK